MMKLFKSPISNMWRTRLMSTTANFRYTAKDGVLTKEDRVFYEENGYLVVKGLVSDNEIKKYDQRFADIASGKVEKGMMLIMRDIALVKDKTQKKELNKATVTKIQDFVGDDGLFEYCLQDKILDYVKCIIGDDGAKAIHTMYINKPPDVGMGTSRHPLHQDYLYFPINPIDKICAAWTALQPIDEANGCLVVKPGSHVNPGKLLKHGYPENSTVNFGYYGIHGMGEEYDTQRLMKVIMDPGDTVFFHPFLIHGSGINNTTDTRRALSTHYASTDCTYTDVTGTLQEGIGREVEQALKKKLGVHMDFADIWKFKSRLVYGKEGEQEKAL